jgi:hypothetical protein
MSEYQYYEFRAVDRPLTAKQIAELRALSTRAEITATSFTNEYQWGDFKGSPEKLMEKYFDAHVYVANWGTHILMLRLPKNTLGKDTVAPYCFEDTFTCRTTSEYSIVEWCRNDEPFDEWVEGEGWMGQLLSIRDELERGDYRSLYLGWLYGVSLNEEQEDVVEPPVPTGLGKLTTAQRALIEFLDINKDLVAAAAKASAPPPDAEEPARDMMQWVKNVPLDEARAYLLLLLQGKSKQAERELRQKYTLAQRALLPSGARQAEQSRRSLADLRVLAQEARAERLEYERKKKQREAEKKRQEREWYLVTLAEDFERHWKEVDTLAAQKIASAYDRARDLLIDLSESYALTQQHDAFRRRFSAFCSGLNPNSALIRRLDKVGLSLRV